MRKFLSLVAVCAALLPILAGPLRAQSADAEIEAVIGAQIEAFRADDFATAFTFASPNIQRLFQTPERFGSMVREGYPMVWRPAEVTYLDLDEAGGRMLQTVMIRDGGGGLHLLEYQMIREGAGWRINGVRFLRMPQVGA